MWKEGVKDMKMAPALEYRRQTGKSWTPEGRGDSSCHLVPIKKSYFRQTPGRSQELQHSWNSAYV